MIEEIWRQCENSYWVSNFGNAREKDGVTPRKLPKGFWPKLGTLAFHRVIYSLFVGNIPKGYLVYWKDKNRGNNRADNLFLVSPADKMLEHSKYIPKAKLSQSEFINRVKIAHGDKYDYSNTIYTEMKDKIKYSCPLHGEISQSSADHLGGHGCRKCYHDSKKTWAGEQDDFLRLNYKKFGAAKCASELGKTDHAVRGRAKVLNITKRIQAPEVKEIPNAFIRSIQTRALTKKKECTISAQDIWNVFGKQGKRCAFTGEILNFDQKKGRVTASVDRIDRYKGYVLENIQVVHVDINLSKHVSTDEYYISLCERVNRFRGRAPRVIEWEWDIMNDTERPVLREMRKDDVVRAFKPFDSDGFLKEMGSKPCGFNNNA